MSKCNAETLLKEHKLKATRQRILVLDKIINTGRVFTIQDIEHDLDAHMDQATIYRIMTQLKKKGIVREVLSEGEIRRFEISCIHNPVHAHFQCVKCKRIICLDRIEDQITKSLSRKYSEYQIDEISLNISGICDKCK